MPKQEQIANPAFNLKQYTISEGLENGLGYEITLFWYYEDNVKHSEA